MPDAAVSRLKEGMRERLAERLARIDAEGERRILRPPSGVDLCSNDYLGLANHPLLKQGMADAAIAEGVGSTGSRLLRGQRGSFARVEEQFARFKGAERSLYFSSGYLANLAVLTTFPEACDTVFSDERNHASLIDGIRLSKARRVVFPHNDVMELGRMLRGDGGSGQKFVVVESLFSMDGDKAPLADYARLCRDTGSTLIVDEAHAVGVYGDNGRGLVQNGDAFVSINTAGKALGVGGAFVAGPHDAIEYLIQRARPFIFSTAPPPAIAAALEASLEVIAGEPERRACLLARARYLRRRLGLEGDSPIVPVIIGESQRAVAVAQELQGAGFDVRAIRPPTVPHGTARLRITVNQGLSEEVLDQFVTAFQAAIKA